MNRLMLALMLLVILVLTAACATYAQEPLAFYGHFPTAPEPYFPSPYVLNYIGAGIYLASPYAPPGYNFSQPYMGLPLSPDVSLYVTGPYGTGSYANGPYLSGDYSGQRGSVIFVNRIRRPGL